MAGRKPDVEDVEILRQFELSSDPVFGASELADMLDMTRQGVDYRLRELEADGLVERKIVSRDRVWWLSEEGKQYLAGELDAGDL